MELNNIYLLTLQEKSPIVTKKSVTKWPKSVID